MDLTTQKLRQIEAEMAKFESEIGGRQNNGLPPPMPPPLPPGMAPPPPNVAALNFLPHSLGNAGGGMMIPRPPPMGGMPPTRPPMGLMPPGMLVGPPRMPPMGGPPPMMMMNRGGPPHPPRPAAAPTRPSVSTTSASPAVIQSGPVISGAPTRYLPTGAKAAAASGISKPISLDTLVKKRKMEEDMGPAGPSGSGQSMALMSDLEAMEHKRNNEKSYDTSYNGQVISGKKKPKRFMRAGGGSIWEDPSLGEWGTEDFRVFVGNLGNEVSDELLNKAFRKYPSYIRGKVVRDRKTNKSKGYGFVSFSEPTDFGKAMREMNGKYVGNRPIKMMRSMWKERNLEEHKKRLKTKEKLGLK